MTNPPHTATEPSASRRPNRSRATTAPRTKATGSPSTSTGWTTASEPTANAHASKQNALRSTPTPSSHSGRLSNLVSSPIRIEKARGTAAAARCCSTDATA